MNWSGLVDTSKLAGWVRGAVASALGIGLAKWPWLSEWLSPDAQAALGAFAAALVVGLWSHLAKQLDPDYSKQQGAK